MARRPGLLDATCGFIRYVYGAARRWSRTVRALVRRTADHTVVEALDPVVMAEVSDSAGLGPIAEDAATSEPPSMRSARR
jgi:hypothetical protein